MELQLLISYCQPVSVFIDENESIKVSCHLKQAYIHFKTDYFKGNFIGKAGMVATGGELRHISNKSPYNGIKPIQYQAFANFFVAKLNIIIEAEGCSNLKKVIDYLHLYPDKVGQTFLKILQRQQGFVKISIFPVEVDNFFYWFMETKTNVFHFIAP